MINIKQKKGEMSELLKYILWGIFFIIAALAMYYLFKRAGI